ncbi:NAD(P)-binding protein [Durotheca rogersii]|uniref:NAD(P)-binding protein n=1 Tax=Durotheca rogersii TaxID=419775 RepID=UPI00221E5369|nr:NAD(P)-binding protein [Durotheca rogersii]KAI5857366.1 NAD(P)-binding protein [Durotheca rogersii]
MASLHNVLLLGGNGKIAQLLTPLLLQRSWNVTSIIRDPAQVANLQKLGDGLGGKLNVLVRSLEEVTSDAQAKSLIDEVKPDYVVWSAGAGGKGAPERTYKIDRDAAIHFIRASVATPSVTKFVMISFLGSRLARPAWWSEEIWQQQLATSRKALQRYYEAKVAADEVLYVEGKKRPDFAGICLRPGRLTTEPVGKVGLGKLPVASGTSSRASVAHLTALLLDAPNVKNSWLDMLDGDEDPEAAVKRCVEEGVDCAEGEPFF